MERPESALYARPPDNKTARSHSRSSERQLECDADFRMSRAWSLFTKAGLHRGPDARHPSSIAVMIVRLKAVMGGPRHECEGERNCPLNFRLPETLLALCQLALQPDECLRVPRPPSASDCEILIRSVPGIIGLSDNNWWEAVFPV